MDGDIDFNEKDELHPRRYNSGTGLSSISRRDVVIFCCTSLLWAIVVGIVVAVKKDSICSTLTGGSSVTPAPSPVSPTVCPNDGLRLENASSLAAVRSFARKQINASNIGSLMEKYSMLPHIAGSNRNNILAVDTYQLYQSYGFDDVRVQRMPALLMNLTHRSLNRTTSNGTVLETFDLDEKNILNQPGWSTALPPTNGYTGKGKVSGPLVWANYGTVEDFEAIQGINLTGSIVVVRYGSIFRGDKVKYAQSRGAAGVIICLDPFDMVQGAEFPNGPWANNETVQRGSITDNEGDPLTPTWPSEFGGPTIPLEQTFDESVMGLGMALPTIPVQPISFGNAQRLLQGLGNNPLPSGWNNTGFLSLFQNGIGPGPAFASLEVQRDLLTYNLTNVIGVITGAVEPDRTVIFGAHRDAWTYGAADPISGHSVVLEVGRALGELRKTGWRPRRSIQLCSWDAEEWAIIGSNEYVETNAELLRQRAVAYLNLDIAVSGREVLEVNGSPLLQHVAEQMASEVTVPATNSPLSTILTPFEACGSGSDHVGFIQLAGVPVLDCGLVNVSSSYEAVYHSNYDNYYWMSQFGDPGFSYHAAMAQYHISMLLYMSDSNVLPLHVEDYATKLHEWVAEYQYSPNNSFADFSFMTNSLELLDDATTHHALRREALAQQCEIAVANSNVTFQQLREVNDISMGMERVFLGRGRKESGQDWYLHVIFTPSASDSYAATTMPLIASGLATKNVSEANFAIGRVAQFVRRAATFVNSSSVSPPWYANLPVPLS